MAALVITGAPGVARESVSVSVALPVPPLLVALNVTDRVPAAVGVPEISPAALTDKPEGNPVAAKLVGELVAVDLIRECGASCSAGRGRRW